MLFRSPLFLDRPNHHKSKATVSLEILAMDSNQVLLPYLISKIDSVNSLSSEKLREFTRNAQKDLSIKGKALFMPIRVALTGHISGPEIFIFAEGLGKEECLARLRGALEVHRIST